ncbi:hypothetical protein GcM3_134012 [Golovinomyces cichoracearum]|uniref:Uncharacterized protein n=1 Tax=Golovinomyces cichoracearum TaxID=62708 RepID=A0A420I3A8_9PEZI|nr:hypothetical protein GcM3_134012 [Golovinomyces cichoracearum]
MGNNLDGIQDEPSDSARTGSELSLSESPNRIFNTHLLTSIYSRAMRRYRISSVNPLGYEPFAIWIKKDLYGSTMVQN